MYTILTILNTGKLVISESFINCLICKFQVEERGYDVNHRDAENVTLLHWAAINNRLDIVKYLIMKGDF